MGVGGWGGEGKHIEIQPYIDRSSLVEELRNSFLQSTEKEAECTNKYKQELLSELLHAKGEQHLKAIVKAGINPLRYHIINPPERLADLCR